MSSPPRDLVMRSRTFSVRLLDFSDRLERSGQVPGHVIHQLARAGTSIGAHNAEAESAISRRHLRTLRAAALREARETQYWLGVAMDRLALDDDDDARWLAQEISELVAILTTIVRRLGGVNAPRRTLDGQNGGFE